MAKPKSITSKGKSNVSSGKKKFANLEEKKKKGVKLNQVERKKMRKIVAKKEAKASEPAVTLTEAEERLFKGNTLENIENVEVIQDKKKRVSFSNKLELTKEFTKKDVVEAKPSTAAPGRSILAKKNAAKKKAGAKVEQTEEKKVEGGKIFKKKSPKVQVTRKVKEALLTMDRKQRKAFLLQLKAKKQPHFQSGQESKKLWEKIRSSKTSETEREKCFDRLAEVVKGKCATLLYAHDTCRVLQCLLDKPAHREQLFQELTPELLRMTKSKYAIFFLHKMLRLASKTQRDIIINSINGHCVKLLKNSTASQALETIFNDYATASQRFSITSEFYGTDFLLYRDEVGTEDLDEIFKKYPTKKKAILGNIRETLEAVVDKEAVKHTLTHRLLREYITHCTVEERNSLISLIHERVPEILHTPDGALVSMQCVWHGTVKERKVMVKNFKDCVVAACKERFGHRVLLAIFDTVDDTVLVNKHIITEIGNNIADVCQDKFGQKVLHYLVQPRGEYFLKSMVEVFASGDGNEYSKKKPADRYAELFAGIVEPLLTYMAANMREILFNPVTVDLVWATLQGPNKFDQFERKISNEQRAACYAAIAEIANEEFIPMNEGHYHVVEDMFTHLAITKILRSESAFEVRLSDYFADLPPEQLHAFIGCQKGCFVLVAMMEHGTEKAQKAVRAAVKPSFLAKYNNKGAGVLLKKLKA
uniref:PUM-HD domain-containing protein n=1 Tax=Steinernema glaseri TaxID=37863 RepID=A0A1I7YS40_9BILA